MSENRFRITLTPISLQNKTPLGPPFHMDMSEGACIELTSASLHQKISPEIADKFPDDTIVKIDCVSGCCTVCPRKIQDVIIQETCLKPSPTEIGLAWTVDWPHFGVCLIKGTLLKIGEVCFTITVEKISDE